MAIVTISRGTYSKGKEIAEKLAEKLGYQCLSREIILEASEYFNIPEIRLERALHDSPSILNRFTSGGKRYIAFFRCSILQHLKENNVVYHGLAGHFFCQGIPHVMKVRIIANMETRIQEEMKRENISEDEARRILMKDDHERQKWANSLYGIETWDPKLYDIVLRVDTMKVEDIVDILAHSVAKPCFAMTESNKKILDDMHMAAQVELILAEKFPEVQAVCKDSSLHLKINSLSNRKDEIYKEVNDELAGLTNIKDIQLEINPVLIPD